MYIWARPPGHGMRAGKLSRDLLYNMGITDGAVRLVKEKDSSYQVCLVLCCLIFHPTSPLSVTSYSARLSEDATSTP